MLPAKVVAAVDMTAGLLNTEGSALAAFGTWLPTAEHRALFAADCWLLVSVEAACWADCAIELALSCARTPAGSATRNANIAATTKKPDFRDLREIDHRDIDH